MPNPEFSTQIQLEGYQGKGRLQWLEVSLIVRTKRWENNAVITDVYSDIHGIEMKAICLLFIIVKEPSLIYKMYWIDSS